MRIFGLPAVIACWVVAGPLLAQTPAGGPTPAASAPLAPATGAPTAAPQVLTDAAGPNPVSFWIGGEYLYWFFKDAPMPTPLATAGSANQTIPGGLNEPGTDVLYGGHQINGNPYQGGRVSSCLFAEDLNCGLEVSGFLVDDRTTKLQAGSDRNGMGGIITRPFVNALALTDTVAVLSFPNAFSGGVRIRSDVQLWGAEANLTARVPWVLVDYAFLGFRFLDMNESLEINDTLQKLQGGVAFFDGGLMNDGDFRMRSDHFNCENLFYGGQVGLAKSLDFGIGWIYLRGNVGVGYCQQRVEINGQTSLTTANGTGARAVEGGLLAVRSNIGDHDGSDIAVVPEGRAMIGFRLTRWVTLFGGYSFLYWSSVVRPGEQVDRFVDVRQVPSRPEFDPTAGGAQPGVPFKRTDFWAQGVSIGLNFNF